MNVKMIVALGMNGEIGKNGDLIWKIPADLKRFKALTTGHPVIMGRKTWESLPKKPLPNRRNIILTRDKNFMMEGAETVDSIETALKITEGETPFIIGGAQIYKAFLPYASELCITSVLESCQEADTFLKIDFDKDWELTEESPVESTLDGISFKYLTYTRKSI